MGKSKQPTVDQLRAEYRRKKVIETYQQLSGNISMKELGELVGVSEHTAIFYINGWIKNKFKNI